MKHLEPEDAKGAQTYGSLLFTRRIYDEVPLPVKFDETNTLGRSLSLQ